MITGTNLRTIIFKFQALWNMGYITFILWCREVWNVRDSDLGKYECCDGYRCKCRGLTKAEYIVDKYFYKQGVK